MTLGEIKVAAYSFQLNVATSVGAVFAAGGAALGRFFNAIGAQAEQFARSIILLSNRLQIVGQNVITSAGRHIDFLVQRGDKLAQIEVKYSLPYRAGPQLDRLVGQMQAMVAEKGQAVVWSLQRPDVSQLNRIQSTAGTQVYNKVQFVDGIEGLQNYLRFFFDL